MVYELISMYKVMLLTLQSLSEPYPIVIGVDYHEAQFYGNNSLVTRHY